MENIEIAATNSIDKNAMFKFSYGLFVLSAKQGEKDNACIINTGIQITESPKRIIIGVNKANYTHDMILETGIFNISILSTDVPFSVFQSFGFCSGATVDKFSEYNKVLRSENGLLYLSSYANTFISGKVYETVDCGTHTLFIADVTEAKVLSDIPSVTYTYYFENIKPKPAQNHDEKKKKGFVCKICGYVYEGDTMPADFICPICKHGAEDFEPIE